MRSVLLLVLIAPALLLVAPGPLDPTPTRTAAAGGASDAGLLAADPPAPRRYYGALGNIGWVVAVDATSLTLRERGYGRGYERGPGGNTIKYPVCPELTDGQVLAFETWYPPYPLADVRVGDLVAVNTTSGDMVYEICIYRRPGGRLGPPSVVVRDRRVKYNIDLCFTKPRPYHEWVNAIQDYEERGIPLPPEMRPPIKRPALGLGEICPDGTVTEWVAPPPPERRFVPPPVPKPNAQP